MNKTIGPRTVVLKERFPPLYGRQPRNQNNDRHDEGGDATLPKRISLSFILFGGPPIDPSIATLGLLSPSPFSDSEDK
jgi:hypothetical protein